MRIKNTWKEPILIILIYTSLTILLTYPLAFHLTTHIPSDDGPDSPLREILNPENEERFPYRAEPYQMLWYLWHFKHRLIDQHANPFISDLVFQPTRVNLVFNTIGYYPLLLGTLTQLLGANLILSYNFQILTSFILAAFFMYLLVYYLTKRRYAAFLCGLAFSFSAYHYQRAINGHLELQTVQYLPLFLLFLIQWQDTKKVKYAIYTGLILTLNSLVTWYYGLFLILVLFLFFIVYRKTIHWKQLCILLGVFFITILPFTLPFFYEMLQHADTPYWESPITTYELYSADLAAYFIPSAQHTLFGGKSLREFYITWLMKENLNDSTVYIRPTTLFFALLGFILYRKKGIIHFFGLSAFVAFLLSLGPTLYIFNRPLFTYMPYYIFQYIPFFNAIAEPARFSVIARLCLVILSGYGIVFAFSYIKKKTARFFFFFAALTLFLTVVAPIHLISTDVSAFYKILRNAPREDIVLELPLEPLSMHPAMLYYQTTHQHPMINGVGGRIAEPAIAATKGNPLVRYFSDYIDFDKQFLLHKRGTIKQNVPKLGSSLLSYYNIRWIILHKKWFGTRDPENIQPWIQNNSLYQERRKDVENLLNTTYPFYEDDEIVAYHFMPINITFPFLTLGTGWYAREVWYDNKVRRWMQQEAEINIIIPPQPAPQPETLRFRTSNFYKDRTLIILLNNEHFFTKKITNWTTLALPIPPLQPGTNTFTFISQQQCTRPISLNVGSDPRCLSFTIENITLTTRP